MIYTAAVIAPYSATISQTLPPSDCAYTCVTDVERVYSGMSYMDAYFLNDSKGDTSGGVRAPSTKLMNTCVSVTARLLFDLECTFTAHNLVLVHSGRVCDDFAPHLQRLARDNRAVDISQRLADFSPSLTGRRYAAGIHNGGAWFITSPSGKAHCMLFLTEHPSALMQVRDICMHQ